MKAIVNVQILRFVAAAMVLFSHVQHQVLDRPFFDKIGFRPIEIIFWPGGVDVFFIISGFIMFYQHGQDFGKPHASANFLLKRLIRVAPLYWIFSSLFIVATWVFPDQVVHSDLSLPNVVASYFFIPMENSYGYYYPVLILGWTLNFEILFYAIFCGSLFLKRSAALWTIIVILLGMSIAPFLVDISNGPFDFWCNPIILEFLFGVWLAHLRLTGVRWNRWVGLLVVLTGIATMIVLKQLNVAGNYELARCLWMGLPALLICAGPVLFDDDGRQGPLRKAASLGGDASYALYLSHPFAIGLASVCFVKLGFRDPWLYMLCASVAALGMALATHLFVERPISDVLRKFAAPGKRAKLNVSSASS